MAGNNDDITELKCGMIEQNSNNLQAEDEKEDTKTAFDLAENKGSKDDNTNVTFIVEGEKLLANKSTLAEASDVFKAMFFGPMADNSSEVEIIDCDNTMAFKDFLKFVEEGNISLSFHTVRQIWYLSQKYMIEPLSNKCRSFVSTKLAVDNVLLALQASMEVSSSEIEMMCLEFIRTEISLIVRDKSFFNSSKEVLKLMLEQDQLDISEIELFLAVKGWCIHQLQTEGIEISPETKREMLGGIRCLIRFPQIGIKNLMKHCLLSGILLDEEYLSISKYVACETSGAASTLSNLPFPLEPRLKKSHIFVDVETELETVHERKFMSIRFTVNRKCWLMALQVFYAPRDIIVFSIQSKRDNTIISNIGDQQETPATLSNNDEQYCSELNLHLIQTPVKILPNVEYLLNERKIRGRRANRYNVHYFSNPNSYMYQDPTRGCFRLNIVNEYKTGMISGLIFSVIDKTPIQNINNLKLHEARVVE